ncbi:hypothetical protein G3I44_14430 [Halogeometricum borinquense]|uniref:Uncharacterized protein n=1 Tax=Halogeometricum borinquense TaxID=60847 RepID=A0A6C0ULB3_9EURY|nr:hypothetical protein [Halogeometricum borinquense]QIB75383.1 hypothetical protein G3I44_14430 [Halogeometricum borinquense]
MSIGRALDALKALYDVLKVVLGGTYSGYRYVRGLGLVSKITGAVTFNQFSYLMILYYVVYANWGTLSSWPQQSNVWYSGAVYLVDALAAFGKSIGGADTVMVDNTLAIVNRDLTGVAYVFAVLAILGGASTIIYYFRAYRGAARQFESDIGNAFILLFGGLFFVVLSLWANNELPFVGFIELAEHGAAVFDFSRAHPWIDPAVNITQSVAEPVNISGPTTQ